MKQGPRFEVRLHPDAVKEYRNLDNSIIDQVNKAIDELENRADEIGKPLRNTKNTKLAGCKEIKLRDIGIRIVFRITGEKENILRIVYVIAIEQRSSDYVFKVAYRRLVPLKKLPGEELTKLLDKAKKWGKKKK